MYISIKITKWFLTSKMIYEYYMFSIRINTIGLLALTWSSESDAIAIKADADAESSEVKYTYNLELYVYLHGNQI